MASVVTGGKGWVKKEVRQALRIDGLEAIQSKLGTIMNAIVGKEAKQVYMEAGLILRNQARTNAPVRTGRLRNAIFAGMGDPNKPNVLVGVSYGGKGRPTGAPHAHLVEYGSSRWPGGHPYFRPAITQSGPRIGATIKEGLQAIIEKHTR